MRAVVPAVGCYAAPAGLQYIQQGDSDIISNMQSMTVKQLIEALSEQDLDAVVYVDVPERYLKPIFYEAFFTIEEVTESNSPKRVNLFSFEPGINNDDLNAWPESFRHEYVLKEEHEAE